MIGKRTMGLSIRTLGLLLGGMLACSSAAAEAGRNGKHLIYMTVWRGCEAACEGFKDYVSKSGMRAEIIVRNADRDKTKLPAFVDEARALNADLVVTWGTSVTLGMAGTLTDHAKPRYLEDIPVVFMIVADPVRSGIIRSYERSGRKNVTGTRNRVPEIINIKALRSYNPAFKHLGLLYNSDEPNSVIKMKEMQELAARMKFKFTAVEATAGPDGRPVLEKIPENIAGLKSKQVDFIYLGSSSFLRKNGDAFTRAAVKHGIPVLSPYEHLVRKSAALMSIAARYYDVGQIAGEQAKAILIDRKFPGDLPVRSVANYAYVINMKTARELKMFPSVQILQYAETVNQ